MIQTIDPVVEVKNIATYIKAIQKEISDLKATYQHLDPIVVFRGESFDYKDTACMPNIFRTDILLQNPKFEKSLFDEMFSQNISSKTSYLTAAINAQHGGFPSRLLDVTYNALTALYFATEANSKDNSNTYAYVYIFFVNSLFTATSEETIKHYEQAISSSYNDTLANTYNHKLIDHSKVNKRIIAQQGALILFPGTRHHKINNMIIKKIKIPQENKLLIQEELETYFGITKGFIYPEAEHQVDFVKKKLHRVETESPSNFFDLKYAFKNFEAILRVTRKDIFTFYTNNKKEILRNSTTEDKSLVLRLLYLVNHFEAIISDFILLMDDTYKYSQKHSGCKEVEEIKGNIEKIYDCILNIYNDVSKMIKSTVIKLTPFDDLTKDKEIFK